MVAVGIILFIIAIGVICFRQFSTQKELDKLISSEREKIGEVLSVYQQTKEELGTSENSVSKQLTVMGNASCDEPLISPLGNKPCLYYSMKVTSKRIEHYTEKDSEGRTQNKTRTIEDVLDQSTNCTRFKLDDGTGTVMVDPHDGSFEGTFTSVNKSETRNFNNNQEAVTISFGNFSMNLSGQNYSSSAAPMSSSAAPVCSSATPMSSSAAPMSSSAAPMSSSPVSVSFSSSGTPSEPVTIKYEEEIIGFDRPLTVVGTLTDKMGEFLIQKDGKNAMIVSTKSQDDMIAERKASLKTQLIVAAVCGALGLICLIIGLVSYGFWGSFHYSTGALPRPPLRAKGP